MSSHNSDCKHIDMYAHEHTVYIRANTVSHILYNQRATTSTISMIASFFNINRLRKTISHSIFTIST